MSRYEVGDIECCAARDASGSFRARVCVAGRCLQPIQAQDYIYESAELFDSVNLALDHAKEHANKRFPPE